MIIRNKVIKKLNTRDSFVYRSANLTKYKMNMVRRQMSGKPFSEVN